MLTEAVTTRMEAEIVHTQAALMHTPAVPIYMMADPMRTYTAITLEFTSLISPTNRDGMDREGTLTTLDIIDREETHTT